MKLKYLFASVASFFLGILCNVFFKEHFYFLLILYALSFLASFLVISWQGKNNKSDKKNAHTKKSTLIFLILSILFFVSGFWRTNISTNKTNPFVEFLDTEGNYQGKIIKEPDRRATHTKLTVAVYRSEEKEVKGRVLLSVFSDFPYEYGDVISFRATLEEPFESEDFSYKRYLNVRDIFAVAYYPRIKILDREKGNFFLTQIFRFKKLFIKKINLILPEPESSLAAGVLIGSKKGMPKTQEENFKQTGLTHIVVVSGYNISMLLFFVASMTKFFSRKMQFIVAGVLVFFFVILTGSDASVVRASIMGMLGFLALSTGRTNLALRGLLFSGFFMAIFNPLFVPFDVGFQLSFLATAGLIIISPFLSGVFGRIPNFLEIRESITACIAAQFFVLPILLFNFRGLSLVSLPANVVVAPFIPPAMLFSFLAVLLSFLHDYLAIFFSFFGWIFLKGITLVAYFFASFDFAYLEINNFGLLASALYYLALILFLIYWKKK